MVKINRKSDREPIRVETHLAGATFPNPDGTSRQKVLQAIDPANLPLPVELVREPLNRYDSNAIAVYLNHYQIGYLSAERAQVFAFEMDKPNPKAKIRAELSAVSSPNRKGNVGATLTIIVEDC
jgi:hypothetical protein